MAEPKSRLEVVATAVQVLSVVIGVVISIWSFNSTREKEAEARRVEADARRVEAEKPFQELRRATYLEAVRTAAIIATPEERTKEEIAKAKKRFRELYVAELSMVETSNVEASMVAFAGAVDPKITELTPAQKAALDLSHALRDSYTNPWRGK